jgi:Family of unknown function (DUF6256)
MSSSLIRQDLVPMIVGYLLIMGTLAIGLRIVQRSGKAEGGNAAEAGKPAKAGQPAKADKAGTLARPGPGWRRLAIFSLSTAVGGYLLLMAVIIGYYFGISPVAGNFVHSAFSGCAMLIGLAAPVFITLSWLAERKGWRI